VCAVGDSVRAAQTRAYQRVARITWQDAYYRTDIGYRAIEREPARQNQQPINQGEMTP